MSLAVEDTWTQKADMPTARFGFGASSVNGKIYAIGGVKKMWDVPFSIMEEYDPGFLSEITGVEPKWKLPMM